MSNVADLAPSRAPAIDRRLSARLQERYRDTLHLPGVLNETLDTLLAHRSVRAYLPDAPPAGTPQRNRPPALPTFNRGA
jgi:hypothetical protein